MSNPKFNDPTLARLASELRAVYEQRERDAEISRMAVPTAVPVVSAGGWNLVSTAAPPDLPAKAKEVLRGLANRVVRAVEDGLPNESGVLDDFLIVLSQEIYAAGDFAAYDYFFQLPTMVEYVPKFEDRFGFDLNEIRK